MSIAGIVERYGGAIVTVTVILAAAGLLSAVQLPADIYPPLVFPRVVVIGHSGTLPGRSMMLTVTRPMKRQAPLGTFGSRRETADPLLPRSVAEKVARSRAVLPPRSRPPLRFPFRPA